MDMNPYKQDKGIIGIVAAFVCATVARTITTPMPRDTPPLSLAPTASPSTRQTQT